MEANIHMQRGWGGGALHVLLENICCVARLTSQTPPNPGWAPASDGMLLAAVPILLQVLLNSIQQVWWKPHRENREASKVATPP